MTATAFNTSHTDTDISLNEFWSRHAESWNDLAYAEAHYVDDPKMEEFFTEIADAATYLAEVHFR